VPRRRSPAAAWCLSFKFKFRSFRTTAAFFGSLGRVFAEFDGTDGELGDVATASATTVSTRPATIRRVTGYRHGTTGRG
jgi:hypothetical protein